MNRITRLIRYIEVQEGVRSGIGRSLETVETVVDGWYRGGGVIVDFTGGTSVLLLRVVLEIRLLGESGW